MAFIQCFPNHVNVLAELSDGSIYVVEPGHSDAITKCSSLLKYSLKSDNTYEIVDYYGFSPDITIPETINGLPVTEIDDKVFFNANKYLEDKVMSVRLPDTLTEIGEYCFYNCDSLTNLVISKNIESIGDLAFGNCDNLSLTVDTENLYFLVQDGILFNKQMTEIKVACKKINEFYDIPDGVRSIADGAFYGSNIKSVTFPESLVSIGTHAFEDADICGADLIIPESVTYIGYGAFNHVGSTGTHINSILIKNPDCLIDNKSKDDENYLKWDLTISDLGSVIIVGYPGSTAQEYAEHYNHIFLDYTQQQPIFVANGKVESDKFYIHGIEYSDDVEWSVSWDEVNGATATVKGELSAMRDDVFDCSLSAKKAIDAKSLNGCIREALIKSVHQI